MAVPVFTKIMGIAFGLTVLFGVVMHLEIARTTEHEALEKRLTVVMALAAVLGMALAWRLARVLTQPLHEVVTGTKRIQNGDLQCRLPVRAGDEIGELAVAFNNMAAALQQKEVARQKLLRQAIAAGEEERKRLARELHDETGQLLTALIAGLGALEARATDAGQRAALVGLRELAAQTLGDIHDVSRTLRPAALDDLGLVAVVEKHCAMVAERFGKPVVFDHDGWDEGSRLSSEIETSLYRIVQEALTNAVRHANARRIQVLLERRPGKALVVVEDDGRGFDAGQRELGGDKLGLLGIEERAALLGGEACLESAPGGGTRLFVEVPVTGS